MTNWEALRFMENPEPPEEDYEPQTVCPYCGYEDPDEIFFRRDVAIGCTNCLHYEFGDELEQDDIERDLLNPFALAELWDIADKHASRLSICAIQKAIYQMRLFLTDTDVELFDGEIREYERKKGDKK